MGQTLAGDCTAVNPATPPPSPRSKGSQKSSPKFAEAALLADLCYASSEGDLESIQKLLDGGLSVNSCDYDRRTALHIAVADAQIEVIKLLLKAGADPGQKDRWGNSALDEAAQIEDTMDRTKIEELLVAAGGKATQVKRPSTRLHSPRSIAGGNSSEPSFGDVAPEMETATLLCCAAGAGSLQSVQDLFARNAELNAADYDGRTALHVASAHGHKDLVKWLLDARAEANVKDSFGLTPLSEATRLGHDCVAELLIKAGGKGAENSDIRLKGEADHWAVSQSEVNFGDELSRTLKSCIYIATWRGTKVVAKTTQVLIANKKEGKKENEVSMLEAAKAHPDPEQEAAAREIIHEIKLLSTLRHPDLVMFLGACFDTNMPFFLTEYMEGGDLERYYRAQKQKLGYFFRPPAETLLRWSSAVARALSFLHGCYQPVIHRDLKPLNLLLTRSLDVKVTDFGISKLMAPKVHEDTRPAPYMSGGVGTWRYMAPEVVRYEQYNDRADIFSFALIMWFMSTGRQPFVDQFGTDASLVLEAYQKGSEPRPDCSSTAAGPGPRLGSETAAFVRLIQDCWHVKANERPSAQECTQRLAAMGAQIDVSVLASFKDRVAWLTNRTKK